MSKFKQFLRDKRGATALTFGLLLVPLMGMTGLAVDYTRASSQRAELQNAADAAVLWGASTYTGNNLDDVKSRIQKSLRANVPNFDSSGATYNVTVTNDVPARIKLSVARPMQTTFMQVLNLNSMDIATTSIASGALTPVDATFTITKVKGTYYKRISVMVVRENGATEEVAALEYTNASQTDGKGTSVPPVNAQSQTFSLGKFKTFYFTMVVKKDGCPVGKKNVNKKCTTSTSSNDQITPTPDNLTFQQEKTLKDNANAFLVRSDRANDAWRLALDGAQSTTEKEGPPVIMNDLLSCDGSTRRHGWEDGGGGTPDFEYTLKTGCAFDYSKILLTQ